MQPRDRAAERYGVGLVRRSGEYGHGGFRCHALIAAYAVHHTGTQADAVYGPIVRIYLCGLLIAVLVRAVQRGQRTVSFHRAMRRDRAGVGDALDAELAC